VKRFASFQEAFLALLSGEIDAVPAPEQGFWKIARAVRLDDRIKTAGRPLREIKRGFAVRKGDLALLERVNRGVMQVKKSP
jgi:ABC-type amino acid transport substrate-binding protein